MRPEHDEFHVYDDYKGLIADDGQGSAVYGWKADTAPIWVQLPDDGGVYGLVLDGRADVLGSWGKVTIPRGHWFTTASGLQLVLEPNSRVIVVQKNGHLGTYGIGDIEEGGRLCYIDGAKDTVLQSPWRKGEACINALFVPPGVHQTMHTHPSTRIGVILDGQGYCETRTGRHQMRRGMVFFLPENGWHKFRTDQPDTPFLNIFAYHPDSDHGPSDEEHPMLNRTMVGEVSAKDMPEIRTHRAEALS